MRKIVILSALSFLVISCKSVAQGPVPGYKSSYELVESGGLRSGSIQGTVVSESSGEALFAVNVRVLETQSGTHTDFDGKFKIENLDTGLYTLQFSYIGFENLIIENVRVKSGSITRIDEKIKMEEYQVELLKPIIYLYPEEEMEVSVELDYDGKLEFTYPKYENGWNVKASPDGTLIDSTGRSYYSLFWEGSANDPIVPENGFVIDTDTVIPFLENKLEALGLNEREANEFIVFWYPKLQGSHYQLIHFAQEEYEEMAKLKITPTPESLIRVMMIYKPLNTSMYFPEQELPEKPERKGFTVVEWGGALSGSTVSDIE